MYNNDKILNDKLQRIHNDKIFGLSIESMESYRVASENHAKGKINQLHGSDGKFYSSKTIG